MTLQVISNTVDATGNWRRLVIQNDANLSQIIAIKVPVGATVAQMRAIAQAAIDDEIARRAADAARQTLLAQITNSVGLQQQGRLSAAQQTVLLNALCAEWKGGI